MKPRLIHPDWPAPAGVQAVQTTRIGGFSTGPYAGFNLATHCGDDPACVAANRTLLREALQLPDEPLWLTQVHGRTVVYADQAQSWRRPPEADACVVTRSRGVAAVLTADCLPVLFCDQEGTRVAAAHAGWRGLVGGVLEATVGALGVPASAVLAWLGPAIGPAAFEVGEDVRAAFLGQELAPETCFQSRGQGKYLADLYRIARHRLHACGVTQVFGDVDCTYQNQDRFYSFRRDGRCGRMASLIWLRTQ